jgi:hypothetical protein
MTIEHAIIPDAQLHQPKGASTAAINTTIKSDGAGATSWSKIAPPNLDGITANGSVGMHLDSNGDGTWNLDYLPHGSTYFNNYAAPYAQVYAAAYAKMGITTTVSGTPVDFTEETTNRLTYTGPTRPHFKVSWAVSLDQATAGNLDISIAVYKNGAILANSEGHFTSVPNIKVMLTGFSDVDLTLNDYLELWIFNRGGAGNMAIYSASMVCEEL